MSNLVDHARDELTLLGEDPATIEGLARVVEAFAAMGHSGSSATACVWYLERLLRFQPLTELTDDPAEWLHHDPGVADGDMAWQSLRYPEAFSGDAGKTYWLVSEAAAGSMECTPIHHSRTKESAQ